MCLIPIIVCTNNFVVKNLCKNSSGQMQHLYAYGANKALYSRISIFLKTDFLHESPFCPHETSELAHRNRSPKWFKVARLDFSGGYLPCLSINCVAMSKDMEKRLPQLYYIKMKISYDLGFIAIGVAMAT